MSVTLQESSPQEPATAPRTKRPAGGTPFVPPTERADRVWHRVLGVGLLLALLIHLVILLAFRTTSLPPSPFAAAGPPMGDYRAAAGGGGGMEQVVVREERQQPAEEEPVPEPEIVPDVPVVVVETPPQPEPTPLPDVAVSAPGVGTTPDPGTAGESAGPGTATGTGQGGGGSAEEGRSGMIAPVPRGMILPPSERPRNVRGREVTVWVFVTERGRVVSDSTRLDPPTPDNGYNQRLKRSAAEWSFEPARRAGRAIAAWYPYQIIL